MIIDYKLDSNRNFPIIFKGSSSIQRLFLLGLVWKQRDFGEFIDDHQPIQEYIYVFSANYLYTLQLTLNKRIFTDLNLIAENCLISTSFYPKTVLKLNVLSNHCFVVDFILNEFLGEEIKNLIIL